jgi:uncharacterized protein (DUF427 family)
MLNPANFPRPPKLEKTARRLQIKWNGALVADTSEAYWVLETYHPPTYYLPRSSLQDSAASNLTESQYSSMCEWKGRATYWDLTLPNDTSDTTIIKNRIWSYESPTPTFEAIKGYLSFYAGPWQCFVDGEEVQAQPGDFYGGWLTSDIETKSVKGAPGTLYW